MVNLDNYEECDSEHLAACRCVVGKAIFMRYENQLEGVEEWSSGWISRLTRDQLESLGGTFYKPKDKYIGSAVVDFQEDGVGNAAEPICDFLRYEVAGYCSAHIANRRFKITVEEL